ncbi:MAG: MBL fold metallo-hydrolase [Pseudomonadota bacterium]
MSMPVADPWFEAERLSPSVTLIREPHVHLLLQANMFLVEGAERDIVIDAGMGIAPLKPFVEGLRSDPSKPLTCVLTHTHIDHMGGAHEFAERLVHPVEAEELAAPSGMNTLLAEEVSESARQMFLDAGYPPLDPVMISALPEPDYDPADYGLVGAPATGLLSHGDRVELGDRAFEVLHLPGHSPGQIGLWDAAVGELFAGDAIYDGPLIYQGEGCSVPDYVETLKILRALPVRVVHGGHDPSFGPDRMQAIIAEYLTRWGAA